MEVVEDGRFEGELVLYLAAEQAEIEGAAEVTEWLEESGLESPSPDFVLVEVDLPLSVSSFKIDSIEWVDDSAVFVVGHAKCSIEVDDSFHSETCPAMPGCEDDCPFNDEWWRLNIALWTEEVEVAFSFRNYPKIEIRGGFRMPPDFL